MWPQSETTITPSQLTANLSTLSPDDAGTAGVLAVEFSAAGLASFLSEPISTLKTVRRAAMAAPTLAVFCRKSYIN